MSAYSDQIETAAAHVRSRWPHTPALGIVLGTGLGSLADTIEDRTEIPYEEIPHFLGSTATGHRGRLVCGKLDNHPVIAMDGRVHAYEGAALRQATLPIRVMHRLGAKLLIVSNAAGGLNPYYRDGDLVVLSDHINLLPDNPLLGENDEALGPRFPDMSAPYDQDLIEQVIHLARHYDVRMHQGVYIAVAGPNLETRAEYRMMRRIGGDVVGMSTVPEVLVAVHSGMKVLAFSVVSNMALPDAMAPTGIDHILHTSQNSEPRLRQIVLGLLDTMK